MSIADKQNFLRDVERELATRLTAAASSDVMSVISSIMARYDIKRTAAEHGRIEADDLIDAFLNAKRIEGRSDKTIEHYRYVIEKMIKTVNIPTNEITIYHLRSYFMQCRNSGTSDRTLEGLRSVFSSYFGWLAKEKLITDNPCANLGPIKHMKKIRTPYSEVELEKLKEACTTVRDKTIIYFLLSTGCRISEICNIDKDDIDFQALECKVLGKGNKERTVFLDDITAMMLKRYLAGRKDDSPALFVGKGTDRMTPGGMRCRLKAIADKAGVQNVHPHRFRRTLATNLIDRGMPIQEVASILGHDNINTTMTYVYIRKENVKNAYRKYA